MKSTWTCSPLLFLLTLSFCTVAAMGQAKRPMTFLDVMEMANVGGSDISSDGKWALYVKTTTDWKAAKRFSDIFVVSIEQGLPTSRQLTYTKDKNETLPRWLKDGKSFVFLSNREAPEAKSTMNQIYWMRPDGGEAQKVTDAKEGVGTYAISKDGTVLAFSSGKEDELQLWVIKVADLGKEKATQLSKHATSVQNWQFSPDSKRVYFVASDSIDKANKDRKEKKFDLKVRNEDSPPLHLWAIDVATKKESRLTSGTEYSVSDVRISDDSKWVGFRGTSNRRTERTQTESALYSELYLIETASGFTERLTNNVDCAESALSFSPDNSLIAFSAADNFSYYRDGRVYIRKITDRSGKWRKLGDGFDGDVSVGFWSQDSKTIYFNEGWEATNQFFSLSIENGIVTQVTHEQGVVNVTQDDESKTILINFSDPETPQNMYTVSSVDKVGDKNSWKRLTDSNPQIAQIALGKAKEIKWKSNDGTTVGGVLVYPLNYQEGMRYPLMVQIHGGPAGVSALNFSTGHVNYSNVWAGAGYFCLLPNYRGSINYGEKFKFGLVGDYFTKSYEDIISGVDYLIRQGMIDKDKMGAMGWSAGGHLCNWILTHTDRFKALSSGAGTMNWISMYAQSDTRKYRELYLKGRPYDNFEHFWNESPLKYIKNAKTPTLIHVVDGDPRVPRPQSEELYMALSKLNVPVEFFVYPGNTHGIPDMRNQYAKMVSEFYWMEKWIKGKKEWFKWDELLKTLKEEKEEPKKEVADK